MIEIGILLMLIYILISFMIAKYFKKHPDNALLATIVFYYILFIIYNSFCSRNMFKYLIFILVFLGGLSSCTGFYWTTEDPVYYNYRGPHYKIVQPPPPPRHPEPRHFRR